MNKSGFKMSMIDFLSSIMWLTMFILCDSKNLKTKNCKLTMIPYEQHTAFQRNYVDYNDISCPIDLFQAEPEFRPPMSEIVQDLLNMV